MDSYFDLWVIFYNSLFISVLKLCQICPGETPLYSSPLETGTQHISVLHKAHNLISRSVLGCGQSGQRVGLMVGNSMQATGREADGECGSGEGLGR